MRHLRVQRQIIARPADASGLADRVVLLCVAVLGYEWLVSGIDKVLSGRFIAGLHANMMEAIQSSAYRGYGAFLRALCLPHCILVGGFIEIGEVLIGAAYIWICVQTWRRSNQITARVGLVSSLLAAFLSFNIFLYVGGRFFISTRDPFDEGIPIDLVMAFMQVAMVLYFYGKMRACTGESHAR